MVKSAGVTAAGIGLSTQAFAQKQTLNEDLNHSGKVAFITGGARGIGREIALSLAKEGANISICDIADQMETIVYPMATITDLLKTKELVEELGVKCVATQADVRSSDDLNKAVSKTIEELGTIDIVVANAGIANMGYIDQMGDQAWQDVVDVNLVGVAKTIKATVAQLKKQESGRIIVISSVAGRGSSPGMSAYNASKWGVIGLTKSIAREVGQANITCNAICPTAIATPMIENEFVQKLWSPSNPTTEGVSDMMKRSHELPVGTLDPIEIANAAVFLCSDQAKAITGIALDVAAGSTARNTA